MTDDLPHSEDSERAVLASIIHTPSLLAELKNELAPERFYSQAHKKIYAAMLALYEEGEEITSVTIANGLNGSRDSVGGISFISSLTFGVPVMTNLKPYIKQIVSTARKRWIISLCERLDGMARNGETEDEILSLAAQRIDEARTKLPQAKRHARMLESMLDDQAGRYRCWHKGISNALPTGFPEIDNHLLGGGLVGSGLYILAARPSMGKTSLGLDLAANIAATGKVVYILSREMPSESLFDRLHSAYSGVSRWKLRPGIYESDYNHLIKTLPDMSQQQIIIDDGSLGVADLRSSLREFSRKGITVDVVIVDYLQLLSSFGRTRNEEVGANSRALKGLAMEFNVPVLTLSQLSRESAKQHREPELEDLRDCLPGSALVLNADSGLRVPISEIVAGKQRFNVLGLNKDWLLKPRRITDAWSVGQRAIYKITTRTGRVLRCSDGHKLWTPEGWQPLSDLSIGQSIGVPRHYQVGCADNVNKARAELLGVLIGDGHLNGTATLTCTIPDAYYFGAHAVTEFQVVPSMRAERRSDKVVKLSLSTGKMSGAGKNNLTNWLREIGVWGKTGTDKRAPVSLFAQPEQTIAAFLRGLFHADGSLTCSRNQAQTIRLSTISSGLAGDVQHLLLRLGIISTLSPESTRAAGFRTRNGTSYIVAISERTGVVKFMSRVGFVGEKQRYAMSRLRSQTKLTDAAQIDRLPKAAGDRASCLKKTLNLSHKAFGWRNQDKCMSRETAVSLGMKYSDHELVRWGQSDLTWDTIQRIEPDGVEEAFDLTVDELKSFCVDDFLTHNSGEIEQDADAVFFLFGDKPEEGSKFYARTFKCSKQRDGELFREQLFFNANLVSFRPLEATP